MAKVSKRMSKIRDKIDKKKTYTIEEAIEALKSISSVKFDEAVEISISLNVNPSQADQIVRGTVILPNGTGKEVRVLVFAKGSQLDVAKEAGAEFAGAEELIDRISKGWLDFDVVISTPQMMKEVSRLGRILGPRKLMPSPKVGTVTEDIAQAVKELKQGKVEFKTDKLGNINLTVGKISFPKQALIENIEVLINAINHLRPSSVRGRYILSIALSSTMGPGLKVLQ